MVALVDNVETEFNGAYAQGFDITGRKCNVSWHMVIEGHPTNRENFKVIGCGHVYVLNYNPNTYKPKSPLTFDEYLKEKQNGKI